MLRVAQLSRQVPAAVRACAAQHRRCGGGARETGNPPRSPDAASPPPAALSKFWSWTTQERADPPRYSASWWLDKLLICTVFAITGSASLYFVRPALGKLGIEGSLKDGPWSYRFASVFMVTPFYTMILLT
ncbi:conserved transmembrane protein, mitochondrial, partial [Diplonema papillatum]